jgi:hypothetical protein
VSVSVSVSVVFVVVRAQHRNDLKLSHLESGREGVVIVNLGKAWCADVAMITDGGAKKGALGYGDNEDR